MSDVSERKRAVWKFPLKFIDGPQAIEVPVGSKVVHVHEQNDQICVWVEVEIGGYADHHPSTKQLMVVGTGHEFVGFRREPAGDWPNAGERKTYAVHRGTAHIGWTVWHGTGASWAWWSP